MVVRSICTAQAITGSIFNPYAIVDIQDILDGKLVYKAPTTAFGLHGKVNIIYSLQDDGGADNFGMDISGHTTMIFTIVQTVVGTSKGDIFYGGMVTTPSGGWRVTTN